MNEKRLRLSAYNRAYYQANRDRLKIKRCTRQESQERLAAKRDASRRYHAANRERRLERMREYNRAYRAKKSIGAESDQKTP